MRSYVSDYRLRTCDVGEKEASTSTHSAQPGNSNQEKQPAGEER